MELSVHFSQRLHSLATMRWDNGFLNVFHNNVNEVYATLMLLN